MMMQTTQMTILLSCAHDVRMPCRACSSKGACLWAADDACDGGIFFVVPVPGKRLAFSLRALNIPAASLLSAQPTHGASPTRKGVCL